MADGNTTPRCATCKFWSRQPDGLGTCWLIDDDVSGRLRNGVPFIQIRTSGEAQADLRTLPTFGCTLHEVKS